MMFQNCRKLTALILSVVLLVAMAAVPVSAADVGYVHEDHDHVEELASAISVQNSGLNTVLSAAAPRSSGAIHTHTWGSEKVERMYYCPFKVEAEVTYKPCTTCRAKLFVIARALKDVPALDTDAPHENATTKESGSGCSAHPVEETYCSKCGLTIWENGKLGGHVYEKTETKEATCTEDGYVTMKCACGASKETSHTSALGHDWEYTTTGLCVDGKRCKRCGETYGSQDHILKWVDDGSYHYQVCTVCKKVFNKAPHSDQGNGTCVCGHQFPKPECQHTEVTIKAEAGASTKHTVTCKQCGKTWREDCDQKGARTYCTDPYTCSVCGRVVKEGASSHNFWKGWEKTATGHVRKCQNLNCQYVESGDHVFGASSDCTKTGTCSICGYRGSSSGNKEHNWGAWTSNGAGAHVRKCLNPGCTAQQSGVHTAKKSECGEPTVCEECGYVMGAATDHNWGHWTNAGSGGHYRSCLTCDAKQTTNHAGGTATCTSPAVCAGCGATYGQKNPNNHAGGTEVRGHVEAAVGKTGYTGDIYCKGCGALLEKGKETPALAESHTHSYTGTIHKDSDHHWKECACGSIGEEKEHTFKDGVCTVCGEADPKFVAPKDHVHTYGTELKYNDSTHWVVCTECGAAADIAQHTYSGDYQSDETGHWRICTACGYKHAEPHDFQSGSCVICGAKAPEGSEDAGIVPLPEDPNPTPEPQPGGDTPEPQPSGSTNPEPQPGGETNPEPAPQAPAHIEDFTDLDTEAVYYEPVKQLVEMGVMKGVSGDTFNPEGEFTRAQVANLLYNLAGNPEVETTANFTDMGQATWAVNAVSWAQSTGVVNGDGAGSFNPNGVLDRQTLATILLKYAKSRGYSTDADPNALANVSDAGDIENWAVEAMTWAVSVGLFTPDENGRVLPDADTDRSMVAIVTVIFLENENITEVG